MNINYNEIIKKIEEVLEQLKRESKISSFQVMESINTPGYHLPRVTESNINVTDGQERSMAYYAEVIIDGVVLFREYKVDPKDRTPVSITDIQDSVKNHCWNLLGNNLISQGLFSGIRYMIQGK
jgi:hypothetical protein